MNVNRKIVFLYICMIILILSLIGILVLVYNNKHTINDTNTDVDKRKAIEVWNYINYETYDGTGKKVDNPFNMKLFTLIFYENEVDVCYDKCYINSYTKNDGYLIINDSDYFSGKFKVLHENDMIILESDGGEAGKFMYYFKAPTGDGLENS